MSKERLLPRKGYSDLGIVVLFAIGLLICGMILQDVAIKSYEIGRSDPRKISFAVKMGLSHAVVLVLQIPEGYEPVFNLGNINNGGHV